MGCFPAKQDRNVLNRLNNPEGRPARRGLLQTFQAVTSPTNRARRNRFAPDYDFDDLTSRRARAKQRISQRTKQQSQAEQKEANPSPSSPARRKETTAQKRQKNLHNRMQGETELYRQNSISSRSKQQQQDLSVSQRRRLSRKSLTGSTGAEDRKITADKLDMVRKGWRKASGEASQASANLFFKMLLGRLPEWRVLFRGVAIDVLGMKLWTTLDRVIEDLPDLNNLKGELRHLGAVHAERGVRPEMYDDFETVFMETLSTILGTDLNLEVRAAWRAVFPAIVAEMREGASTVSSEILADMDDDQKASLVKKTWSDMAAGEKNNFAESLLTHFMDTDEEVKKMFKIGTKAQARKLVSTFNKLVDAHPDLLKVMADLRTLGLKHASFGAEPAHFDQFAESVIAALRTTLGSSFNKKVNDAWADFMERINYYIVQTLRAELGPLNADHIKGAKEAWELLRAAYGGDITLYGEDFHKHLFRRDTRIEGHILGRVKDLKALGIKFAECLDFIVLNLEQFEEKSVPMLEDLAKKHLDYGAGTGDYLPFCEAVMSSMQEKIGENSFSEAHGQGISKLLRRTSSTMQKQMKVIQKQRDKDADKKDAEWMYDLDDRGGLEGKKPWAEVKKHRTKEDCWIVVKGRVYDVTKWLDEHPGGVQNIMKYAGRDATEAFEKQHGQSGGAKAQLSDLYIAEVQQGD